MTVGRSRALVVFFAAFVLSGQCAAQDASTMPADPSNQKPADTAALKPGANSFGESQARKLLESKGYADISKLTIDNVGIWRGAARKDDRAVEVSVDFQGHVAAK